MPKQSFRSEHFSRQYDSGMQSAPESAESMSEHPGSVESTAHFVTHKSAAASGNSEPGMLPPLQKWLLTVVYVRSSDGRSTMVRAVAAPSNMLFCATNSFASFRVASSSSNSTPFAGLEMPHVALQSRIMIRSFFQLSFF